MTLRNGSSMTDTLGYLLIVGDPDRARELREFADDEAAFSEAVPSFLLNRQDRLVALISLEPGIITHIARSKRGRTSATNRHRLNLTKIVGIRPIPIPQIIGELPPSIRGQIGRLSINGGVLSKRMWGLIVRYGKANRKRDERSSIIWGTEVPLPFPINLALSPSEKGFLIHFPRRVPIKHNGVVLAYQWFA